MPLTHRVIVLITNPSLFSVTGLHASITTCRVSDCNTTLQHSFLIGQSVCISCTTDLSPVLYESPTMSSKLKTPRIMATAITDSVKVTRVPYHPTSTARKWQYVRHMRSLSSDYRSRCEHFHPLYKVTNAGHFLNIACTTPASNFISLLVLAA